MATTLRGRRTLAGRMDQEGYREYPVVYLVEGVKGEDGPANAMQTPGLPLPGSPYQVDSDNDIWAFCKLQTAATLHEEKEGEPAVWWRVEKLFSTKPDTKLCRDQQIDDPLLMPPKIGGSFVRRQEEAIRNRFGIYLKNSAHQQLRGPRVEFDEDRMTVQIEYNVAILNLALLKSMNNTVNLFPLWGMPARTIKLTVKGFEKKYYGLCYVYYTLQLEFEIRDEGFDRDVPDEASKVLKGHWEKTQGDWRWVREPFRSGVLNPDINNILDPDLPLNPDPANPAHFIAFQDTKGNQTTIILDGAGLPFNPVIPPTTDECAECDLAPLTWTLSGFDPEDPTREIALQHTAGCEWEAVNPGPADGIVLDFNGLEWVLTNSDTGVIWRRRVDLEGWACMGPNTLRLDQEAFEDANVDTAWETAFLSTPGSKLGTIHVEKYPGSDFLLLGIPAVLI